MKRVKKAKRKQVSHKRLHVSTKLSTKHFSFIFAGALVVAIGVVGYITNQSASQGYASLVGPGNGGPVPTQAVNCVIKGKGYCSTLSRGCGANGGKFRMDTSSKYSCGKNTVCCLPQPSCASVGGYCDKYGNPPRYPGFAPNSTYPGCGNNECFIPVKKK